MARFLDSTDTTEQAKVRIVVNWYKKGHPAEYKQFVRQTREAREDAINEFAQAQGGEHRQLHDIPETMFTRLVQVLSTEEMTWFSTKEGSHWFARTFPEFSLARVI